MAVRVLLAAAVICAGLLPEPAAAAPKPKGGERVTVTGCPFPGVTARCLMIRGADGTVYNITGATPRPGFGQRMIRLRGIATDKFSMCAQGIVLDRIRWTRTRLRCPN